MKLKEQLPTMSETETTETMQYLSSALKTTEEILEELIGGIIPEQICVPILHSRPRKDFIPQSKNSRNSGIMCPQSEPQSKSSGGFGLDVRLSGKGEVAPFAFPNVSEKRVESVTQQHQDVGDKQPCRVCREEKSVKGMNSIFSDQRQYENLPFILKTLVDIEVTPGAEQPPLICALCLNTLLVFFSFYEKVKVAQYVLKENLNAGKSSADVSNKPIGDEVIPDGPDESQLYDLASPMSSDSDEDSMNTSVSTEKLATVKLPKPVNEGTNSDVSPRIKKPEDILTESPFSYYVTREISEDKWKHIDSVMTSADGNVSSLKVLDECILEHPFAVDWHCIECQETISGGHTEYIDHSLQTHVWYPEQVMFPCDVCGKAFPLTDYAGISESYCEHWLQHFFPKECGVCRMKFDSHSALRGHNESVHKEKSFKCDLCEEVFTSGSKLKVHRNVHGSQEVKKKKMALVPCKICKKNVASLWQHNKRLHFEETAWKCEDCDKIFLTRVLLKSHRSRVHPDIKRPPTFKCTVCGEPFPSINLRSRHLYTVHRTREIKCGICDKSFHLQHQLQKHMLSHQATGNCVCEVCGKSVKGEKHLKEHMYIHSGEKPFECPICAVRIRMKSNLWKHMKSVHKTTLREYTETTAKNSSAAMEPDDLSVDVVSTEENQSLRCNDCGKIFESIEILQVHRNMVHLGLAAESAQLWKCDYCDETFDSASAKGKHIEEKHEKEIGFNTTCVLCNKIYPNIMSYNGHMRRTHNGKPVHAPCEICGKVFKFKSSLKLHMRNAHIPDSWPCRLCPRKFQRLEQVRNHMRKEHKGTKSKASAAISHNTVGDEAITVGEDTSQLEGRCSPMSYHSDQEDSLNTPVSTLKLSPVKLSKPLSKVLNTGVAPKRKRSKDILAKSSFSHFVNREISDEKWEHIYTVMTSSLEQGSNLKVLDDCILYHPFARDWHCVQCRKPISGGHSEFIHHSIQAHQVSTPDEVMFPCDVCGLVFPIMDSTGITESYCGHWLNHFFTKEAVMEPDSMGSAGVFPQENQSLRCNDCGDVFETIEILGVHRESMHSRLTRGRAPVLRKCDYCEEYFDSAISKAKHAGEKHPEKLEGSTTCTLCNKKFRNIISYRDHMSKMHRNRRKPEAASCDICGKVLSTVYTLKDHIRNVHTGPTTNSVQCPLCPWKFRRQDLVSNHMRITHKVTMTEYKKNLASSDTTSTTEKK